MKTFGELTFDNNIYIVTNDGMAKKYKIYGKQDYFYVNKYVFSFQGCNAKTPQLPKDKSKLECVGGVWFANAEDASMRLKAIADKARETLKNCIRTENVFVE